MSTSSVHEGEVVVVIGPSGSGKSTLCRCINRLEPIDSGGITFDGRRCPQEGANWPRLRADVGMVFQSFNLFAHMTVLRERRARPDQGPQGAQAEARGAARALLDRVGVGDQAASTRPSSPAASSSGWPSPARWPCTPR